MNDINVNDFQAKIKNLKTCTHHCEIDRFPLNIFLRLVVMLTYTILYNKMYNIRSSAQHRTSTFQMHVTKVTMGKGSKV